MGAREVWRSRGEYRWIPRGLQNAALLTFWFAELQEILVLHTFHITLGVPPDRQKVMVGGVTLQDDDWGKAKAKIKEVHCTQWHTTFTKLMNTWREYVCWILLLSQNAMLMMMGSAEALPSTPAERPKFIEDMSEAEAASAVS